MTDAASGQQPVENVHEWDAAYVLGALSPDDRRRFEAHLEECADCRAAVGELAVMPALLSRVPNPLAAERAAAGSPFETQPSAPPAGSDLLAALAHRVRRRRLARRWGLAAASAVAALAIAAAIVLPARLNAPDTRITLAQTVQSPITATVSLTSKRWGTEIGMTCGYAEQPAGFEVSYRSYALYVTDASGRATRVSSWSAWPGSEIHTSGAVDTPKAELRTVQVRDVKTGTVLLSSPVR
ncbi:zf-HC2 domain-containing protein [Gryllotalpicola daejeonensis]|uniref:Zf-HC2 domain-containing protein n=1 Tax=Gryllotalpicola daejeonensis TaxID=993087 RepID=A0ABP7ZLH9_9MICO